MQRTPSGGLVIRSCAIAAAALWAVSLVAQRASAQQPTPIRIGETVAGTLTQSDPMMADRGPFRVYELQAEEGTRLIATLRSGAFDAFLMVVRPVAGISEEVASDDDGGGGTDARVRWLVPATGTYQLVAQALSPEERGGFTLIVEHAPPARPPEPRPIAPGETKQGELDDASPFLYEGNGDVFYELYRLDARKGQELLVTMESADFDTYLGFGALSGTEVDVTSGNDDAGGTSNSSLRLSIKADGTYGILARALTQGATGSYTISVREIEVAPPQPIAANTEVTGSLGEGDVDSESRPFQAWLYRGTAGETIGVRMRSSEFDTYLVVGRVVDGAFEELTSNDDESDESTDSVVLYTLPADGEYVIRATAFSADAMGAYTLRVDSMAR